MPDVQLSPDDAKLVILALHAEIERLTEEANDLDSKLGSALRAIGLEHADNERLDRLNTEHWNALRAMAADFNVARAENEQLRRSLTLYEREIEQLQIELEEQRQLTVAYADHRNDLRALIEKHNDECRECPVIEVEHG